MPEPWVEVTAARYDSERFAWECPECGGRIDYRPNELIPEERKVGCCWEQMQHWCSFYRDADGNAIWPMADGTAQCVHLGAVDESYLYRHWSLPAEHVAEFLANCTRVAK